MTETESETQTETQSDTQIVEYNVTEAGIAKMGERLAMTKVESKEDRDLAALRTKECVDLRMKIEAKRKELKAGAIAWGKKVDSAAQHFTGLIADIEQPLKQLRVGWDDERKAEREAKKEVERQRVAAIDQAIAEIRKIGTDAALLKTAREVQEQLDLLVDFELIEEMFQEKIVEAEGVKADTLAILTELVTRRVHERQEALRLEEQRAAQETEGKRQKAEADRLEQLRLNQEANDRQRREQQDAEDAQRRVDQAAQQKKIDDQNEELERKQRAIDAEAQRQQNEKDEAERVEREAKEEEERAAQAEIDRKAEAARLEALKPDRAKAWNYGKALRDAIHKVRLPDVEDRETNNSIQTALQSLHTTVSVFVDSME